MLYSEGGGDESLWKRFIGVVVNYKKLYTVLSYLGVLPFVHVVF